MLGLDRTAQEPNDVRHAPQRSRTIQATMNVRQGGIVRTLRQTSDVIAPIHSAIVIARSTWFTVATVVETAAMVISVENTTDSEPGFLHPDNLSKLWRCAKAKQIHVEYQYSCYIGPCPLAQVLRQYADISSVDHTGWRVTSLGRNSTMTGLMSMTGVPSMASSSDTTIDLPDRSINLQIVLPMRFGLFFARCTNMPTLGQLGLFLGWRAPFTILSGATVWNRKSTSRARRPQYRPRSIRQSNQPKLSSNALHPNYRLQVQCDWRTQSRRPQLLLA